MTHYPSLVAYSPLISLKAGLMIQVSKKITQPLTLQLINPIQAVKKGRKISALSPLPFLNNQRGEMACEAPPGAVLPPELPPRLPGPGAIACGGPPEPPELPSPLPRRPPGPGAIA